MEWLKEISILLAFVIYELYRKWRRYKDKLIRERNSSPKAVDQTEKEVEAIENEIKHDYSAMRMFIIHFSNGTVTDAGLHLVKISFKHEVLTNHRVESVEKYFQEVSLPPMYKIPFTAVINTDQYHLHSIDDLDLKNPGAKEYHDWLKAYEVRSVLWIALKNKNGVIVAVMVMHFPANSRLDDSDIQRIKDRKKDIERVYNRLK